ncbi:putative myo-inositol transporter 1 [Rosellinia necatrix]|uniref:Putative myo-inositol transporter 1 n=1 Tax=Rosellinia necatrix TaxID=77044 RepID=A0A1W2TI77_ROSNE|nr:putative myo-inositol transporter 1 [Rosellinia necatrix]
MSSQAEAPLLRQDGDHDHDHDHNHDGGFDEPSFEDLEAPASGHDNNTNANANKRAGGLGYFVWLLTLSAAISGLLFGYDTGVISATLVSIGTSLSGRELTSLDKSIITSSTSLFALVASPLSSVLADRLGRKPVILVADVLFVLGALIQASSASVALMVLGRSVVGLAIGAASFVTPLYLAELAPARRRGMVVTMNVLSITLGQAVAYVVGWLFAAHGDPAAGWRLMVGVGALPALLQCLLLFFMPETPRWLVRAGRSGEARAIIRKTAGEDPVALRMVDSVLKDIEIEVREEEEEEEEEDGVNLGNGDGRNRRNWPKGWEELLFVPKNRRALTIACLLQGLQQLCGFNSLMYFSATIFLMLGFAVPTLTSLTVAVTNFVFTVAALLLIDRIGRRRILLYSIPFMASGLLATAFGFHASPSVIARDAGLTQGAAMFILVNIMVYVAAYAIGLGNVPWMQSELFPLNVRSLGSGLATATNWLANFVVGLTFLPLMDALTPTWTFVLYGIVSIAGWISIWCIYPETVGLSLEDATSLLEHGWGVR